MVGQLEGLSKCHFFKLTFVTRVIAWDRQACPRLDLKTLPGNTKGGSITVPLTSCLTGLDQSVLQIKTKIVRSHTADYKPVKQEVNGTVILPPLVFPDSAHILSRSLKPVHGGRGRWAGAVTHCFRHWQILAPRSFIKPPPDFRKRKWATLRSSSPPKCWPSRPRARPRQTRPRGRCRKSRGRTSKAGSNWRLCSGGRRY